MDTLRSLLPGTKFSADKNRLGSSILAKTSSSVDKDSSKNLLASVFLKKPPSTQQPQQQHGEDVKEDSNEESHVAKPKKSKKVSEPSPSKLSEEEVNAFRNRMHIKVKTEASSLVISPPVASFPDLPIHSSIRDVLLRNIEAGYWKEPTPIQMQGIPVLLKNQDVLACAPTGSGKTATYVIPILSKIAAAWNGVLDSKEDAVVVDSGNKKKKIKKASKHNESPSIQQDESPSMPPQGIQALILAPTLELTEQIYREVNRLKEGASIVGRDVVSSEGTGRGIKVCHLTKHTFQLALNDPKKFWRRTNILIATPLRLLSLLQKGGVDLSSVSFVVLDEADKLLEMDAMLHVEGQEDETDGVNGGALDGGEEDEQEEEEEVAEELEDEVVNSKKRKHKAETKVGGMKRPRSSFLSQVDEILSHLSLGDERRRVQRALFSATLPPLVLELGRTFLHDPVHIKVGDGGSNAIINQKLLFVGGEGGKLTALRQLISEGVTPPILIFTQSIHRAMALYKELLYDGIHVDVLHSGRGVGVRSEVIKKFRSGDVWVLICTDILARGVDFPHIKLVVNFDLPPSPIAYIHRIGRTGRGGREGEAITFFTEGDLPRLRPIANVVRLAGGDVPDWMLKIPQLSTRQKRNLRQHAPRRADIDSRMPKDD
eukprot:gene25762-31113_t